MTSEATPATGWRTSAAARLIASAEQLRRLRGVGRLVSAPIARLAEAIAVGLLRKEDVSRMVSETYLSRPNFYDPNRYELPYERQVIPMLQYLRDSGRLLDGFCGQGREAKLFAQAGFEVTAVDQLPSMIEAAKAYANMEGFDADFIVEDFARLRVSQPFNVVYTSCWMYSTVQSREARRDFLKQCANLCHPSGIVVISYVSSRSDSWLATAMSHAVAKLSAVLTQGNLATEYGERIYRGLFWHHLPDGVVEDEVHEAGFRVAERMIGKGLEPTFLFLCAADEKRREDD